MELNQLKDKFLWQMTGEELLCLLQNKGINENQIVTTTIDTSKKYVYGISGIARLFGCSIPTANRIKKSGKIDKAITQIGRKIIVDSDLALELAGYKTGGRR
ncbi:DUF3853 family protein [Elizabethkingia anophelis]|uniref:DUF3853 family protein n=1 Tax=Elizabethkingia ursingii TaxID=1756150 RepID=A0ABX3N9A4_9FLAO|nr:DUF3853 family protein [Elizabethkingia ursingii]EJK5329460.1 DUF3853 family protein [Elizabethkingia meningoseptica]MCT3991078.1 DUF3853 family protein [Elizabethkingia anophelis]MCT4008884.1 DUF3853 family protein [Elizabethkingia anophelis]MCT4315844.1 DUF3853 family protein [Elizabethkingia anophelis]MDV3928563.1 DUF3853 domain-containing protein [Elizabethkingia anophelis]